MKIIENSTQSQSSRIELFYLKIAIELRVKIDSDAAQLGRGGLNGEDVLVGLRAKLQAAKEAD